MEILTASWVLPVLGPPLPAGRVAVEGGRVAWVGRAGDAGEPAARCATWAGASSCRGS